MIETLRKTKHLRDRRGEGETGKDEHFEMRRINHQFPPAYISTFLHVMIAFCVFWVTAWMNMDPVFYCALNHLAVLGSLCA